MIPMDIWVMQYLKPEVEVSTKRLERKPVVEAKPPEDPEPEPEPEPEPQPAPDEDAPVIPGNSVWDQLAMCESSGRWDLLTTGNGYYFALQFSPTTWISFGGDPGYLDGPVPSRDYQIQIAEAVQAIQGWNAWPGCSREIGLI